MLREVNAWRRSGERFESPSSSKKASQKANAAHRLPPSVALLLICSGRMQRNLAEAGWAGTPTWAWIHSGSCSSKSCEAQWQCNAEHVGGGGSQRRTMGRAKKTDRPHPWGEATTKRYVFDLTINRNLTRHSSVGLATEGHFLLKKMVNKI